jgi:hypothetical protein
MIHIRCSANGSISCYMDVVETVSVMDKEENAPSESSCSQPFNSIDVSDAGW